jgi:hypothetical protein
MLIVDVSEVKLPGEAKQNNLPPECGQPIDGRVFVIWGVTILHCSFLKNWFWSSEFLDRVGWTQGDRSFGMEFEHTDSSVSSVWRSDPICCTIRSASDTSWFESCKGYKTNLEIPSPVWRIFLKKCLIAFLHLFLFQGHYFPFPR